MNKNFLQKMEFKISSSEDTENKKLKSLKRLTAIIYALQAVSFLVGVIFIVAVIINYVKKSEVKGTWLESHFRWQIRTFWTGTICAIGGLLIPFLIFVSICLYIRQEVMLGFSISFSVPVICALPGILIYTGTGIWIIYRIVKGWWYLNNNRPMYKNLHKNSRQLENSTS